MNVNRIKRMTFVDKVKINALGLTAFVLYSGVVFLVGYILGKNSVSSILEKSSKSGQGAAAPFMGMTLTFSRMPGDSVAKTVSVSNMQFVMSDGKTVPLPGTLTIPAKQSYIQTTIPLKNAGSVLSMQYKLNAPGPCIMDVMTPQARSKMHLNPHQAKTTANDIAVARTQGANPAGVSRYTARGNKKHHK